MRYQAVLFDLDGVVIDTRQAVTEFWQETAAGRGVSLTPSDFDQHVYGCPPSHTLDVLFAQATEPERQSIIERMAAREVSQVYTPIPGVVPLLRQLKEHGISTALVTSADTWKVNAVSRQLELDGLFTTGVMAGDYRRGKPDPECYLRAAARLQVSPVQCLVFEDALSGVRAAVAAGTACVGVQPSPSAQALLAAGAVAIIPDFTAVALSSAGRETGSFSAAMLLRTVEARDVVLDIAIPVRE